MKPKTNSKSDETAPSLSAFLHWLMKTDPGSASPGHHSLQIPND